MKTARIQVNYFFKLDKENLINKANKEYSNEENNSK